MDAKEVEFHLHLVIHLNSRATFRRFGQKKFRRSFTPCIGLGLGFQKEIRLRNIKNNSFPVRKFRSAIYLAPLQG